MKHTLPMADGNETKKICVEKRPYLLHFAAQEFEGFRRDEMLAICDRYGMQELKEHLSTLIHWNDAFVPISLNSDEEACTIIKDSILLKDIYDLWCSADTMDSLCKKVQNLPSERVDSYLNPESPVTFKVNVLALHKKIPHAEQIRLVETVLSAHARVTAPISLDKPQVELGLMFDYAFDKGVGGVKETSPRHIFYGRRVASGNRNAIRQRFSLKERHFLGNTSMDVHLSFIMSNLARIQPGHLVYDPFVGTGSLLLAAAYQGARCLGSDIDYKLMHGMGRSPKAHETMRSSGENVRANFRQYGFEAHYMDCFIADAHILNMLRHRVAWLDAIITDPPYGVREASRKVVRQSGAAVEVRDPDTPHFPKKESCSVEDTYGDLLRLASRLLRIGGHLVFWLPVVRGAYIPDALPSHPAFQSLSCCEQTLNTRTSRLLLTMVKVAPFEISMDKKVERAGALQPDQSAPSNHIDGNSRFREEYFKAMRKRPVEETVVQNNDPS